MKTDSSILPKHFPRLKILSNILLLFFVAPIVAFAQATNSDRHASDYYVKVTLDDAQQLEVTTKDNRKFKPEKLPDQIGFRSPQISSDGTTVGWLTLHDNCCTSYPIPLVLVIYRNGKVLQKFEGNGTPIWKWCFIAHTKNVAFSQQPTHGAYSPHYELHNMETGKLIAEYEGDDEDEADFDEVDKSKDVVQKKAKRAIAPDWVNTFPKDE